jgi:cytochrome c oxidase accessory protein FixG
MDRRADYRDYIRGDAELHDVTALNRREERSLYATRQKVHPKLAHGTYRRLKWVLMAITLGIYYAVPWLRWDRGPDLPNQAVLLDMEHERFFMFGLEIWPQEFYFVTGLLILAALGLFLVTSLAGRVWCGYFCPQTVWTDLMIAVERFWQGDRSARIRLDKEPWGLSKIAKKAITHISWLAIGMLTGGAFVFYFADAPTLLRQIVSGTAPQVAYVFIGIFTLTTYVLGGLAREQVCIYMCPWPRIQGAMIDKDSFLVSYRDWRGEPRGQQRKSDAKSAHGDCIDCKACIAVCPMSIDIRDGAQLECIQCGLCIDACNDIMARVDRPQNLIGYATIAGLEAEAKGGTAKPKLLRPRTLLYAGLMTLVGVVMLVALTARTTLDVNVQPDRNPLFVRLSDGGIRNGYTVKILNKLHEPRTFEINADGLAGARLTIDGYDGVAHPTVSVATDVLSQLRIFVAVSPLSLMAIVPQAQPFTLVVRDTVSGQTVRHVTTFRRPQ